MTDNAIALFKGAGLPAADVAQFKKALFTASQVIQVAGGTPFLKMLKQDGTWVYGANETEVQEGSQWAINPLSLKTGYVCWNPKGGKPLGQQVRSIFQSPPLMLTDMPDLDAPWSETISLELQCLNGEDKGTAVEYTGNSYGCKKLFSGLVAALQKQLDVDAAKVVPIVSMTNDSYKHPVYGLTFNPIFEIVGWMSMGGPEAATPPAEPPAPKAEPEAPKRRGRTPLTAVPTVPAEAESAQSTVAERVAEAAEQERTRVAAEQAEQAAAPAVDQPVQRRRRRVATV